MMTDILFAVLIATGALWILYRGVRGARQYNTFHGQRIVTCPETERAAAVEANAALAGLSTALGVSELRLSKCSRWPERAGCGQDCLAQIEVAPHDCLVKTIVNRWYEGHECVVCHRGIEKVDWLSQQPALMDGRGNTVGWNEVPVDKLPEVLENSWPVCWNCHTVLSFRRAFPDLGVDRKRELVAQQQRNE